MAHKCRTKSGPSCTLLFLLITVAKTGFTAGQQPTFTVPAAPVLVPMHQEINWNYYCDPNTTMRDLDRMKCIRFNPGRPSYLSMGGEIRERGEYFDHPQWGPLNSNSGFSLQRSLVFADVQANTFLRGFVEFQSGLSFGRDGGPRPVVDKDELSLHQAFLEIRSEKVEPRISLRVGRQELSFGSSRLVGIREGPNVRQSFDGLRLTWKPNAWDLDVIATKPVENNTGLLKDRTAHEYAFWGVYASHRLLALRTTQFDVYYFGIDRKKATFEAGSGREQRETFGARVAGTTGAVDHDTEAIFQSGTFADRSIRAWAISTNTGYTFARASETLTTRLGFDSGIISGNRNPSSGTFGTFNALFPKGSYFGEAQLIGPYNAQVVRPSIRFRIPRYNLTVWPNAEFLWRQSRHDGVYAIPGILVRPSGRSTALYIGQQANINIEWRPTRHLTYALDYVHFFPGTFLKETGPAKGVNFVAPWITYSF